jgi:hypothetical protein
MKKLLLILPLLLVIGGCEEEAEEKTVEELLSGTWKVTNMGAFENANCSGSLDYTEWSIAQSFGVTMNFTFNSSGTVDIAATVFGISDTETLSWTATDDELCIDGECIGYVLSDDNSTLTFVESEDAYCEDMDGNEVEMTEAECGSAGNDWYDEVCYELTMTKQ